MLVKNYCIQGGNAMENKNLTFMIPLQICTMFESLLIPHTGTTEMDTTRHGYGYSSTCSKTTTLSMDVILPFNANSGWIFLLQEWNE